MAKLTTKELVKQNESELLTMTTHKELREWAVSQGLNSASGFSAFKKALIEIGINYDELKGAAIKQQEAELDAKITHALTLYTDAKASANRFGVCDVDGEPLWHGRFFDTEDAGEQSRAELCAAKKAVWLANKIKEANHLEALELNLFVDAEWLTYQDHAGQKGYVLTMEARKNNIRLNVIWIPGNENPADKWTVANGYKKWVDNDFTNILNAL